MSNFYIRDNIIRRNIWNVSTPFMNGHYTTYTNIHTGEIKVKKMGDFGTLTYFPEVKEEARIPTGQELEFIRDFLFNRCGLDLSNINLYPDKNNFRGCWFYIFEYNDNREFPF